MHGWPGTIGPISGDPALHTNPIAVSLLSEPGTGGGPSPSASPSSLGRLPPAPISRVVGRASARADLRPAGTAVGLSTVPRLWSPKSRAGVARRRRPLVPPWPPAACAAVSGLDHWASTAELSRRLGTRAVPPAARLHAHLRLQTLADRWRAGRRPGRPDHSGPQRPSALQPVLEAGTVTTVPASAGFARRLPDPALPMQVARLFSEWLASHHAPESTARLM